MRSGIEIQNPKVTVEYEKEKSKEKEKEQEDEWVEVQVKKESGLQPPKHMVNTQVEGQKEDQKKEVKPYKPPALYPERLGKQEHVQKFIKFLEMFTDLHINIPLVEAIAQMPKYVKLLKELISSKKKLQRFGKITLNKECSAIVSNKLPLKCKHPGSVIIPCSIGTLNFSKALCDSGASINLMPLYVYRKLGLGEAKTTSMCL